MGAAQGQTGRTNQAAEMRRTKLGYLPVNFNLNVMSAYLSRTKDIVSNLRGVCWEVPNNFGGIIEGENRNVPGFTVNVPFTEEGLKFWANKI